MALLRPPMALWGYSMQATDEAMERIAASIRERDVRIVALEQLVTDLTREPAAPPLSSPYPQTARHRRAPFDPGPPFEPAPLAPRRHLAPRRRRSSHMTDVPSEAAPGAGKGPVAGPDGRLRCPWGLSAPEYVAYHDTEWGRPVHGDQAIFERLCLEAFQSGLSWLTILRKRENFRAAFAGFDIEAVAAFGSDDVARLLADAGIVRNRAKINAAITNARAALELKEGLSSLFWSHAGAAPGRRRKR